MEYPYFKAYRYEAGQLHKYGSPSSTGIVGHDLDSVKARIKARHPNPDIQFVIVECLSTYRSRIVEVLSLEAKIQSSVPEPSYTFQDAIDGKVNFNLKSGFRIVCNMVESMSRTRYEVSVLNPEGLEVWWSWSFTEEGGLDSIKRATRQYKN